MFLFVENASGIPRAISIVHMVSIALRYGRAPITPRGTIVPDGVTQAREITLHNPDCDLFIQAPELTHEEEAQHLAHSEKLRASAADEADPVWANWSAARVEGMARSGCELEKAEAVAARVGPGERLALPPDFVLHTGHHGEETVQDTLDEPAAYISGFIHHILQWADNG
jgi:hypothetical protein